MNKLLVVAVLLGAGLAAWALPPFDPPGIVASVTQVVDGVTFQARITQVTGSAPSGVALGATVPVRLLGLEAVDSATARQLATLLLEGKTVYLELDKEPWDAQRNLQAYVYLDAKGELMVNLILVTTAAFKVGNALGLRYATQLAYMDSIPSTTPATACEVAVPWDQARTRLGERLCVEGPVASVGTSAGGDVFLNLGRAYPDPGRFTLFIPARVVGRFEAALGSRFWNALRGRTVRAIGEVKLYQGVPEIVLEDPANLIIVP